MESINNYDIVQYVEENFGIKLLEYQKELLRQMEPNKPIYIIPTCHGGYTILNDSRLTELIKEEYHG